LLDKYFVLKLQIKKRYISFLVICVLILPTFGQETDSLFYLRGRVISNIGEYPVALAHVINVNQKRGVFADTLGRFEIWVKPGDKLNISAIGFEYSEYAINGIIKDSVITVLLRARSYEIPEASISYLGTYKQFEYKVLNLKLEEIKINPEFEKLFKHIEPPPLFVEPQVTSPASLIYVLFSKDAKDKNKFLELSEEEKVKEKVRERYNEQIIGKLTGLDGLEARKFMEFCDFRDSYILSIDDYNLYSEIYLRLGSYKKSLEDSLKKE
jgi:hypothetical protein